jgi:hypothetical protein
MVVRYLFGISACLAAFLMSVNVAGQTAPVAKANEPAPKWTPTRTLYGQPDFEGIWAIATLTPLERPPELAGKAFFTPEEAAAWEKKTLEETNRDRRDGGAEVDLRRNYNEVWRERGTHVVPSRRTSLIVDPPDGRIPPFTPEARKKRAAHAAAAHLLAGPEDLALRIRCITRGLPMVPTPNNNFFRIVQSKGDVLILQEMMYEARVIPLDGRPHVSPAIRTYMGDSRGHWDGDTLVIDTTNYRSQDDFYGADDNFHLVERLTRIDPGTILYQFTVDDPTAYTRPWSAEIPFTKTDEGIFDYECQEGNYALIDILRGARAQEKKETSEPANK